MYGVTLVAPFSGNYAFLNRDDKERSYDKSEDSFVFGSTRGPVQFKQEALAINQLICELGAQMGLPVTTDPDRGIRVFDEAKAWDEISKTSSTDKAALRVYAFLLSNSDIAKKFCIVRGVAPGWWTASYAGKTSASVKRFSPALTALGKATGIIEQSSKFKSLLATLKMDAGDPIDTNVGYPLFSAEMDAKGTPIARLKLLEMFSGIGYQGHNLQNFLKEVDRRAKGTPVEGWPFCIAPLRRLQPGYKWNHSFKRTSQGFVTDLDFRGYNTNRVAFMASYLLNLAISPIQMRWKVLRMMLPGAFHDGDARRRRLDHIRRTRPFIAEGDYSNYDRFIPIPIFTNFTETYVKRLPHGNFWRDILAMLHHDIPMIWPDYGAGASTKGWIFKPRAIGLLSGLKITSEEGTLVNVIVNVQALIDCGVLNASSAVDYLTQYINKPAGSGTEHFFVQSDDTLLMDSSLKGLITKGKAFRAAADDAGIKGSLMFGDRFLMRHMFDGCDLPVPCRVWQNTLSNEEPYDDALKFLVGLAMRTDGLLGQKTYDPFSTGKVQSITLAEALVTQRILISLEAFLTAARSQVPLAVAYIKCLRLASDHMVAQADRNELTRYVKMDSRYASELDQRRNDAVAMLAARELELSASDPLSSDARLKGLIYQLHKNANVPSSKMILDQIVASNAAAKSVLDRVTNKENTFFRYAMQKMGFPLDAA